jgi:hypothetical protein
LSGTTVLRGQPITLSVTFFDAGNNPIDPTSGPLIDIFPAGKNPENIDTVDADAMVLNASATSLGDLGQQGSAFITRIGTGRYQYTFTIPTDPSAAPLGTWYHRWNGTVDSQALEDVWNFVVIGGGSIGASQLYPNNRVNIQIFQGIQASDGTGLSEDYQSYYTTSYNPLYCSVRKLRLEIGPFVKHIPDDTLNLALFESSIDADAFTFRQPAPGRQAFFKHARRQYVCCSTASGLLSNQLDTAAGSKRLGDLAIELGGATIGKNNVMAALQRVIDCMTKWRLVLQSGGAGFNQRPSMIVKGGNDPDRPIMGRLWEDGGSTPAANAKLWDGGTSRRAVRGYASRKSAFDSDSQNIFRGSGRLIKKRFL